MCVRFAFRPQGNEKEGSPVLKSIIFIKKLITIIKQAISMTFEMACFLS